MTEGLHIRPLLRSHDDAAVLDLFQRAADYVVLEEGCEPDADTAQAFFADCVPGGDLAQSVKLGAEEMGRLIAIADMGFGYPDPDDAYIGLLLLDAQERGRGVGRKMLAALTAIAKDRSATRLLIAVLEANPRGKAFWQREGFVPERIFEPQQTGSVLHRRLRMTREVLCQG